MALKTVDDVLLAIQKQEPGQFSSEEIFECLVVLAKEIKELKRTVAAQGLLIEHEEHVRTDWKKRPLKSQNVPTKFKVGDRVVRLAQAGKKLLPINPPGTIQRIKDRRALVRFDEKGVDRDQWLALNRLKHTTAGAPGDVV